MRAKARERVAVMLSYEAAPAFDSVLQCINRLIFHLRGQRLSDATDPVNERARSFFEPRGRRV